MSLKESEKFQGNWNCYFDATRDLPPPERTQLFLSQLPQGARILDFGCGTGRYALAFLRDRPDITIDLLDNRLSHALPALKEANRIGERWDQAFEDWKAPVKRYDAIWANASLFFILRPRMMEVWEEIRKSLKPGGLFAFSWMEDCEQCRAMHLNGVSEEKLKALLAQGNFEVSEFLRREDLKYGEKLIPIPTFLVYARKSKA